MKPKIILISSMYLKLNLNQEEALKKRKKRTVIWVVFSHIIVLVIIFLVFTFKGCARTKEQLVQVSLVSPNEADSKIQTQEKRNIIEPKKQQEKQVEKVIKKVPRKNNWKPLDPSQIKKSNTKIVKKYIPEKSYAPVKASDIATNIRKNINNIKFSNSFKANASTLQYYDKVSAYLYDKWKQPSRAAVGGRIPVVNVEISIDSKGKVLGYNIKKRSGIRSMDTSVSGLLRSLSYLPKPPNGAMKIDVYLEISE